MAPHHRIYLVPGFFGFANLGELLYFSHTRSFLTELLEKQNVRADVISVHTHPTASIRTRTLRLLSTIKATAGDSGPIHLVGHSTGGIDARRLVSPEADLGPEAEKLARRVVSVVTVATPHHGTPMASTFQTFFGAKLLQLLSLFTVHSIRLGRVPLALLFRVAAALRGSNQRIAETMVDQLFAALLADFSAERRDSLAAFFAEVSADQSLLPELMPASMAEFNAKYTDRSSVRYASVVTVAPPPTFRSRLALGVDVYAQISHGVYTWLHILAGRMPPSPAGVPTAAQLRVLSRTLHKIPAPASNDGIVPSLSQHWGEVLCGVEADHHDVIGHFDDPRHEPPHVDWLTSGSNFRRPAFEQLWTKVLEFLLPG